MEVVPRREACNLAYLPVGSLEWHGPHLPFGTDYMTVTHLAEEAARRYGGVVFPPIYYSDVRYYLQECRREWRESYLQEMQVPGAFVDAFGLESHKTKDLKKMLDGFGAGRKVLLIDAGSDRNLRLSSRNLPKVKLVPGQGVNIHDVVDHELLIFSKEAILQVQEVLSR